MNLFGIVRKIDSKFGGIKSSSGVAELLTFFKTRFESDFQIKISKIEVSKFNSLIHPIEFINSNQEGFLTYLTIRYQAYDPEMNKEFLAVLSELLSDENIVSYYNVTYNYFEDFTESIFEVAVKDND